jgi:periplasmic protein TonB
MFEDSLLESAGRVRTRRGLTTATSFALQSLLLATLLLLPLFYTEALPGRLWLASRVVMSPPPPLGDAAQPRVSQAAVSDIWEGHLRMPQRIPRTIAHVMEQDAPSIGSVLGVPRGTGQGAADGVLSGILDQPAAASYPLPPEAPKRRLQISQGVVEGLLIHQVRPAYPSLAMQAHIQGEVVLHAIIGSNGGILDLRAVSGHPMLVPAALDAVRQWRYKPYMLNGRPVEVETLITIRFVLGS